MLYLWVSGLVGLLNWLVKKVLGIFCVRCVVMFW